MSGSLCLLATLPHKATVSFPREHRLLFLVIVLCFGVLPRLACPAGPVPKSGVAVLSQPLAEQSLGMC